MLQPLSLDDGGTRLACELALPSGDGLHPGVLVFSNAHGIGPQARETAEKLAGLGYVALATDMYGDGLRARDPNVASAALRSLSDRPERLRERAALMLEALRRHERVAADRLAAIGYCFGGQCVLELARSGADVQAVVSYHGLLKTMLPARPDAVRGEVAVFTGANDPYAPPEDVAALRSELVAAGARWHITEFGDGWHSFTDPDGDVDDGVPGKRFDPMLRDISWAATLALLKAVLRPPS